MEFFEELALSTAPTRPRLWKRYVDDTFCVVKRGSDEGVLLTHLNSIRKNIQFTMELESDGKISFLDCLLHRGVDSMLPATVYRKPTHTDRYEEL